MGHWPGWDEGCSPIGGEGGDTMGVICRGVGGYYLEVRLGWSVAHPPPVPAQIEVWGGADSRGWQHWVP